LAPGLVKTSKMYQWDMSSLSQDSEGLLSIKRNVEKLFDCNRNCFLHILFKFSWEYLFVQQSDDCNKQFLQVANIQIISLSLLMIEGNQKDDEANLLKALVRWRIISCSPILLEISCVQAKNILLCLNLCQEWEA
jgi:hypothetical protein